MKNQHAVLAIALLGGVGLYLLLNKSSGKKKNMVETIPQIESEIKENSSDVVPIQGMPSFGRPVVMMNDRPMRHENYVDVQKNTYFKPKVGAFFR